MTFWSRLLYFGPPDVSADWLIQMKEEAAFFTQSLSLSQLSFVKSDLFILHKVTTHGKNFFEGKYL